MCRQRDSIPYLSLCILSSLVDVVSEMIGGPRVVVIGGIVYVLAVRLLVGVLRGIELGVVRE